MTYQISQVQHELRPLTDLQIKQLLADLNKARVAELKKGRTSLSYLEAWDVRATLNRIFGFGGWSAQLIDSKVLRMDHDVPAFEWNSNKDAPKVQKMELGQPVFNWRVVAQATMQLHIHQLGAFYSETGIAGQVGPDVGEVADFAMKTCESDALKRAAVNLGTQFGLSLYNDGQFADVVKVLLAPGQRQIDVAYLESTRRVDEDELGGMIKQLRQQHDAAQQPQQAAQQSNAASTSTATQEAQPAAEQQAFEDQGQDTPAVFDDTLAGVPTDDQRAAAQSAVSGAFGG
jgi:recombination DNA repair RAD52 pathway protein